MKTKMKTKAQVSLEGIIVIIFLIIFIILFENLAQNTVQTIEISKIKQQQQEINLSLLEFIKYQDQQITSNKFNILDWNSSYNIPNITIPSKKIDCNVSISQNKIESSTLYNGVPIITTTSTFISNQIELPIIAYCGQTLNCFLNGNNLKCE